MGDSVTIIDNNPTIVVDENITLIKANTESPSVITILDNNTSEVTVVEQVTEVTVQGVSPSITVEYGGTRGPIYTPEAANFGSKELLAYLVNAVDSSHLTAVLQAQIDSSTTGLDEARENLLALIEASDATNGRVDTAETSLSETDYAITQLASRVTSTEAGDIDAIQTQFTQTAEDLALVATRFDTAENLITSAQLEIDSTSIRMTVAEEAIDAAGTTLISQVELLSNQWTLKIQEGTDGNYYAAGLGLTVYPDWAEDTNYYVDDWVMYDSLAYKCTTDHTSSDVLGPYWTYMPGGVKSTFGVLADQFYIKGATGESVVPFIVDVATGNIILNSDTLTSGVASFISYTDISDTPTSLDDINASEVLALNTAIDGRITAAQAAWAINNNTTLISGAKIITGSLVANSIYAEHIILGGVTQSKLATNSVSTTKVEANAITQVYSGKSSSSYTSLSLTLDYGYTVCIMATLDISHSAISGITGGVTRDGTTIWSQSLEANIPKTIILTDSPGPGTHTYTLKGLDANFIPSYNLTTMILLVHKR